MEKKVHCTLVLFQNKVSYPQYQRTLQDWNKNTAAVVFTKSFYNE